MNDEINFIFHKKGYGRENWELRRRIDKAIEGLNYYIEGMNESIRTWEVVKEETEISTDYITNMLEREKRNYEIILDILKGSDEDEED